MNRVYTERFKDAPWIIKRKETIFIGGAGGISSWLTLFLSRVNMNNRLNINVFDFDTIEHHNIGGQFYQINQAQQPKVKALATNINLFTGSEIVALEEAYKKDSIVHHICFSGFDNMNARKIMFENWKKSLEYFDPEEENTIKPIFIDGRLTADNIQIFCVTPKTMDKYSSEHLFSDNEVQDAPCSFKQTSYLAAMIGSLMVNCFLNHVQNSYNPEITFTVPFMYEYYAPLMLTT